MKAQQGNAALLRKALQSVPLPPRAVRELLRISQKSDVDTQRIVDTVTSDEALTMRVIRVANSALFGISRDITSVQQATVLLGREAVVQMAVGVAALHMETALPDSLPLSRRSFWRHSMGTAFLARQTSASRGEVDAEQAFTAGLLHDIGKLVLMGYLGPEYTHVLNQAEQDERPLDEIERDMLGIDHGDIGRELCDKWKLSASLREAISIHRSIESPSPLNRIAHVANAAAKAAGMGKSGNAHVDLHRLAGAEVQQVARDLAFIRSLPQEVARIEQAFRFGRDQDAKEALPQAVSEKGTVLVQVRDKILEALLTITLCSLGYTPHPHRSGTKGSGEARGLKQATAEAVGGIIDEPPPQDSDITWLDVASWRRQHQDSEKATINLVALRAWLDQAL